MLRPVLLALVGLALAVGCGSSSVESDDDGEGGEASGGSSNGGSSNGGSSNGGSSNGGSGGDVAGTSGSAGTATGGVNTGGSGAGGTSSGGAGAQGGSGALGGSAGGGGLGGTGTGGTGIGGGMPTDPDCPVNEPHDTGCRENGLRCPYISNGCRCLSVVGNGCYQMDSSCVPMLAPAAGDRVAPPPVHWCTCTASNEPPALWICE
jgi:hypothetical protein